jgi:VWFA-related protein
MLLEVNMMYSINRLIFIPAAMLCLLILVSTVSAQRQPGQQPANQTDDVIRINTDLVQTDVMVFDRRGRFVADLKPEEFELSMAGKSQTISFFEHVASGSSTEAAQLALARGSSVKKGAENKPVSAGPESNGRLIFFFLDDLHMSGESIIRARKALLNYVDSQMSQNDQVAIISTSGQIGFLQQLTDNTAMLHTAIARLNYKKNPEAYTGRTQISEYLASQVGDYGNKQLFAYLMESVKIEQQMGPGSRHGDHTLAASYSALPMLQNRLQQINAQGRMATADTLAALQSLILSSSALPGRKVVFFLSDGFIANERKVGALEALQRITGAAARSGVVVYTMDARGTFFGLSSGVDASTNDYVDMTSRHGGLVFGELSAMQEPLKIIAEGTGGRAILNSNSIEEGIQQAIAETSDYYLLAWRPDGEEQRDGKSRLKVTIKNHPDLRVRLRSNFYAPQSASASRAETLRALKTTDAAKTGSAPKPASASLPRPAEVELLAALGSLYPQKQLPVAVSTGYVNTPASGMTLKVSMQIERDAFRFDPDETIQKREVDVIGTAIDDRGIIKTFKQLVTVTPDLLAQRQNVPVIWNQQLPIPPGLYQVRVAVRERATGRTGSALQWIEIPDLARGRFDLSSLFLGERKREEMVAISGTNAPQAITVDVDHHFSRTSVMRFQTYVYNAARGTSAPDVWIQAQVLRHNLQVIALPASKVPTDASPDATRLPYWSEIGLEQLPAGRYRLQVTATDRVTGTSVSQSMNFVIE